MKFITLTAAAALGLAACTLPRPGDVAGNPELAERVTAFCAADFADENVAALGEWIALYNMVAPMIDREPIDADGIVKSEAAQKLLAARSAICLATQPVPAPAVLDAVEAAE